MEKFIIIEDGDSLAISPIDGTMRALADISAGEPIVAARVFLGNAPRDIGCGEIVEIEELDQPLQTMPEWIGAASAIGRELPEPDLSLTFMGFARTGGRPAARNDIFIIAMADDKLETARAIADIYHKPYWIDSVRVIERGTEDLEAIAGIAKNPNSAGALLLGGSNRLDPDEVRSIIGIDPAIRRVKSVFADIDNAGQALSRLDDLAASSPRTREVSLAALLRVGLVAPTGRRALLSSTAIGIVCDVICASGGTILTADSKEIAARSSDAASRICDRRVHEIFCSCLSKISEKNFSAREIENGVSAIAHTGASLITKVIDAGGYPSSDGGVQIIAADAASTDEKIRAIASCGAQIALVPEGSVDFDPIIPTVEYRYEEEFEPHESAAMTIARILDAASGDLLHPKYRS